MATVTSDTSIMDILGGGASSQHFELMEESNDLAREELKRHEAVANEMALMSTNAGNFKESLQSTYIQATTKLHDGIVNPLKQIRSEATASYNTLTSSVHEMGMGVTEKLSDVKEGFKTGLSNVKEGFSSSVLDLKTGFTDAVTSTNEFLDGMSVKMEAFSNLPTEQKLLLAGQTIADGVVSSFNASSEILSAGMESLGTGITAVGGFVKSSAGYLKGLFQKSEEGEDVGGTSGAGADSKNSKEDDSTSGGGIGSLLGKLMPKGLLKMFGKTGKVLGKLGRFAGKLALPLVAIMSIFDFVGGVQNASEIIGKPEDQLSNLEKAGAGLAGVVSGLTLGFVDASTIYSEGAQIIDSVSGFASDIFNSLPSGVQDGLTKVSDVLFSSETGIFSSIGRIFSENIDAIADGDYGTLLLNVLTLPLQALFSSDGIIANTFNSVMELLPNSFKDSIGGFVDTIMGWFDKIKTMASDLIPDSLKSLIDGTLTSDIGKKVSGTLGKGVDSVKGFFGFGGDKEEEVSDTKIKERKSINEFADKKAIDKDTTSRKIKSASSSAIVVRSSEQSGNQISEKKARAKTVTRNSRVNAKAKNIKDSDTATKRSKEQMNKKQDIQPVIIQSPAPAQKSSGSGKQLNTSTTIGDTELAVMNSNMMD